MTIHIGAAPGQIAETVLLPGDPLRARWAAETFLSEVRQVNTRGMLGFTGTWQGQRVTIQGSGMGMASLSIYANELIRDFGARTLVRIGTCGAMQPQVALRDIVLPMTASSIATPSAALFRELRFAPCADASLLLAARDAALARGICPHLGSIFSTDTFYDTRPDLTDQLVSHGTLAVEMETAELFTVAARHGVRALTVLTVSDHLITGGKLDSAARETGAAEMVEIALAAAFG